MTVKVRDHAAGWSVATWLVTHAGQYRISEVRFAGFAWTAATGHRGWARSRPAPRCAATSRQRCPQRWPSARLTVAFG
jgi:hypothetical protein